MVAGIVGIVIGCIIVVPLSMLVGRLIDRMNQELLELIKQGVEPSRIQLPKFPWQHVTSK